jgi:hypothetical protein
MVWRCTVESLSIPICFILFKTRKNVLFLPYWGNKGGSGENSPSKLKKKQATGRFNHFNAGQTSTSPLEIQGYSQLCQLMHARR